ncbi:MAG: hypothetical protein QXG86_00165 [Candidatus Woesearchaeota archaeon]
MVGIIAFNITKISVEKEPEIKGKISIKYNVQFKNVQKTDLFLGKTKQEALKFSFEYSANYEPKGGKILLVGDLIAIDEVEKVKEIINEWNKNKKLHKEVATPVINTILSKCNIEAILLAREVNLPPPVPLPKVKVSG